MHFAAVGKPPSISAAAYRTALISQTTASGNAKPDMLFLYIIFDIFVNTIKSFAIRTMPYSRTIQTGNLSQTKLI